MVLLSTRAATSIISGIVLSYLWLNEEWLESYFVSLPIIASGCLLTIIIGTKESELSTFDEAFTKATSVQSILYICFGLTLLVT
jgi:hypothetical protein